MAIREASAEAPIACAAETAFAWLADPRNAAAWFASVALPEPPTRPLRVGATWRFALTRQRGGAGIPMRLAEYQPPRSFTWETTYSRWRDNLQWALVFTPDAEDASAATLRLTIRQRPGPLGWPLLLVAGLLARLSPGSVGSMRARAERAAQRAREALAESPTLTYGPYERREPRRRRGGPGQRR